MGDEQRRDPRVVHPDADAEAGHPRLRHLEERLADLVPVADAHLVVGKTAHGEVLAELAELEVVPSQLLLPVLVRLDLVDENGALLAAVAGQVALAVAVDVQPPDQPRTVGRPFPHRGAHGTALPAHIARQAHVHREQAASLPVQMVTPG